MLSRIKNRMNLPVFQKTFSLTTAVFSIYTIWYHAVSFSWKGMPIIGTLLGLVIGLIFGLFLASVSAIYTKFFRYSRLKLIIYFTLMVIVVIFLSIIMLAAETNLPTIEDGWEKISGPPEPAIALDNELPCLDLGGVLGIRTESGTFYSYLVGGGYSGEWIPVDHDELSATKKIEDCAVNPQHQKKALRLTRFDEKDTIVVQYYGPDGYIQYNYILTQKGQIYEWVGGSNALDFIIAMGWIIIGILVSFLSSVMVANRDSAWRK